MLSVADDSLISNLFLDDFAFEAEPPQPKGISGRVAGGGAGVGGIALQLNDCTSSACATVLTTTTASDGSYLFSNAPTLQQGHAYHVRYVNSKAGGNTANDAYLSSWRSFDIASYAAGANAEGGTFDITNVKLQSPAHAAKVVVPATFTWTSRGVASDAYRWQLADQTGKLLCQQASPAANISFTLSAAGMTTCGLQYNVPYRWYVMVMNGTPANGYGFSRFYHTVTFTPSAVTSALDTTTDAANAVMLPEEHDLLDGAPLDAPTGVE